jgi:hypothetical protein
LLPQTLQLTFAGALTRTQKKFATSAAGGEGQQARLGADRDDHRVGGGHRRGEVQRLLRPVTTFTVYPISPTPQSRAFSLSSKVYSINQPKREKIGNTNFNL